MRFFDRFMRRFWLELKKPLAKISYKGKSYKVPRFSLNDFYKSNFHTEDWLFLFLKNIVDNNNIKDFIDVGVNIGQTLFKINSIDNSVNYWGFEPNQKCFQLVEDIISINKIKNAQIIPVGLSDSNKVIQLFRRNQMDSSSSMVLNFRNVEDKESIWVPVFKFDEINTELGIKNMDLIKVDVEGAELEVFQGMKNSLKKFKPLIVVEVLPSYTKSNRFRIERQGQLFEILDELDYLIYQIIKKRKSLQLRYCNNSFPIHDNLDESDYFLVPKSIKIERLPFEIIS